MIVAHFFQGNFDGLEMILPTRTPWPTYVIPERLEPVLIEALYLYAGQIGENDYAYLYESDWGSLLDSGSAH